MPGDSKNLNDPKSYGEDLFAIANRAADLAPVYCKGCAAYHWRIPAQRALGVTESLSVDRQEMVRLIRGVIASSYHGCQEISVVLAGSADTGLLATAAHAIACIDNQALKRVKFTVIDQCNTPLLLCLEFASQHDFRCEVIRGNLLNFRMSAQAHLVIMHGVLRFFSSDDRVAFLKRVAGELAPTGRILVSNAFAPLSVMESTNKRLQKDQTLLRLAEAVDEGSLRFPSTSGDFAAEMQQSVTDSLGLDRIFLKSSDLDDLAASCGLQVQERQFTRLSNAVANEKKRILAVLAPGLS